MGNHRAWCHDCNEWCYPRIPCLRCEIIPLREFAEAHGYTSSWDKAPADDTHALAMALHRTFMESGRPGGAGIPELVDSVIAAGWRPITTLTSTGDAE